MATTLGLDFGTNTARALLVECATGRELATAVAGYPSGEQGVILDPRDANLARQHPGDYLVVLRAAVREVLAQAAADGHSAADVIGIGVDTTGSSPLPVDATNTPLALRPEFRDDPNAQVWLWKDHTAHEEAARITALARELRPAYVARCGNTYSSEWFWSKVWHCLRVAPGVFDAAASWVELADWLPSVLAGLRDPRAIRRGVCAAGHKALYADDWGGLPDREFLAALEPRLAGLRDALYDRANDAATPAGTLSDEWAAELGLPAGIPIAIGEFDVHYGAIGAGVAEGVLVKVIGTSTCDCTVVASGRGIGDVPGICGIVPGAILPGYHGIEAGQSAVGDIFKWWVEGICAGDARLHEALSAEAAALSPGASGLLALDWNHGNRTVLVDQRLTGLLLGQTLYTTRAEIYRALIEATAFGARMIAERLLAFGVPVERVVCAGGIAEKNPLLMQIYADVMGVEMQVARSAQTCALGAAVAAAVVAGPARGGHADYPAAQRAMAGTKEVVYRPNLAHRGIYDRLFALYSELHDAFGGVRTVALGHVMKALLALKDEIRG